MASRRRPSTGKPARRVSLQKRDLALMEALVQLRAETLDELHVRFFAGLSRKRTVNRLAQLAAAGYLHKADLVLHGEESPTRVYTLGPKAKRELEQKTLSSEHFLNRRWNPTLRDSSIPHQIAVNRVTRLLGGEVVPEHLLPISDKDGARHRPDAAIHGVDFKGEERLLGIEVDLGHYSRERIVAKDSAWRKLPGRGTLVFVVPDQARAKQVQRWLGHQGSRILTFERFEEAVTYVRTGHLDPVIFDLDIWAGGEGWQRLREDRRRLEKEEREAEERKAREEAERERAEAAAAASAARPAARSRGRWARG